MLIPTNATQHRQRKNQNAFCEARRKISAKWIEVLSLAGQFLGFIFFLSFNPLTLTQSCLVSQQRIWNKVGDIQTFIFLLFISKIERNHQMKQSFTGLPGNSLLFQCQRHIESLLLRLFFLPCIAYRPIGLLLTYQMFKLIIWLITSFYSYISESLFLLP